MNNVCRILRFANTLVSRSIIATVIHYISGKYEPRLPYWINSMAILLRSSWTLSWNKQQQQEKTKKIRWMGHFIVLQKKKEEEENLLQSWSNELDWWPLYLCVCVLFWLIAQHINQTIAIKKHNILFCFN